MKTKLNVHHAVEGTLALLLVLALAPLALGQGALTPPGPPAPMMKTLEQIEPRTPIKSLPCVIAVPGSYYLVANLTGVPAADGITVQADHVTIDLRGFALIGGGGGSGIVAAGRTGLRVGNGSIVNWSGNGVVATNTPGGGFVPVNCQCEQLRLTGNGGNGLLLSGGASVIACLSVSNGLAGGIGGGGGGYGIQVSGQSLVKDCVASQNSLGGGFASFGPGSVFVGCSASSNSMGFFIGGGARITDCAASFNSAQGIATGPGCSVIGCTAFYNGTDGIFVPDGGTIKDCKAKWNAGNGIEVSTDCYVFGNTCDFNTAAGIKTMSGSNRIDSNHVTANTTGIDCSGTVDNFVVRNSAHGNTLMSYNFPAGTRSAAVMVPGLNFATDQAWGNFSW